MRRLLFVVLLWSAQLSLSAQSDLLLYHFDAIPQSLQSNPAMPQQSRLWIGLPGLGGVNNYYHNSLFSPYDLLARGSDINANIEKIILDMEPGSQLATQTRVELLGVAFKNKRGDLWSFGIQQVVDYRIEFNPDLFRLIYYGNSTPDTRVTDISDFDMELSNRSQYYLGYQRAFMDDRLRLGGRLKFLQGQNHAYVERMDVRIETTDSSTLQVDVDALLRTSGIEEYLGNNGAFDPFQSFFPGNAGFSLDLGAWYQLNDRWSLSASVLDLGFISYRHNTVDYLSQGEFNYDGLEADFSQEDPIEDEQAVIDSLKAAFNPQEIAGNTYRRALAGQFYLGGQLQLSEKYRLSGLYHNRIWQGQMAHDVNLSVQARLARGFQLTAGYSIINGTYHNIGFGFDAKLGPVQLYLVTDNLLQAIYFEEMQNSNVSVGLNICLYDRREKQESVEPEPALIPEVPLENKNE